MTHKLDKVISSRKRQELLDILHAFRPSHDKRLWLVGFLDYVGYSFYEICGIISSENRWGDYDKDRTAGQVLSVVARRRHASRGTPRGRLFCLTISGLIDEFTRSTEPVLRLKVPSDIRQAALFYYRLGFTPVPKHKTEKRPMIYWEQYQDVRPAIEQVMSWDWSNGICLLANDEYSFLDIDRGGYASIFNGRHLEITPRGGAHVFGRGVIRNYDEQGIGELKGKGTLIVAYPTPGYELWDTI